MCLIPQDTPNTREVPSHRSPDTRSSPTSLSCATDITFGEELRKAALYVADRKVLFYLIEGERFIISPLDKQEKPKEEGLSLIHIYTKTCIGKKGLSRSFCFSNLFILFMGICTCYY